MAARVASPGGSHAARLARDATQWLLDERSGLRIGDHSLYHGLSGVVLALHEANRHFGADQYGAAIEPAADALAGSVEQEEDCSLYFGLAGGALALRASGRDEAADRALTRIRDRFDGHRWNEMFELVVGNAGIGLGALHAGDLDLAVTAVTPYLITADPTSNGVNWPVRPSPPRSHHLAHGTLGIVYALAAIGDAADRGDLIDLALAGAADVVSRNQAGPTGFLVPHSDPPHRPELIERYSYGWCNGPAGDAQVFRLLARITGDSEWTSLGGSVLAHDHPVRAATKASAGLLGQQRTLLRDRSRPRPRLRPDHRTRRRLHLRRPAGRRPDHPRHHRPFWRALVELRTLRHAQQPATAARLGDGKRRHHQRTPALRPTSRRRRHDIRSPMA